jgi:hypothetical protein
MWCRAPLDAPPDCTTSRAPWVRVRGPVWVHHADHVGDDEAAEVLHLLRASLREAATNHGVRVDKRMGDGAMLVAVESPGRLAAVIEAKWAIRDEVSLGLRGGILSWSSRATTMSAAP